MKIFIATPVAGDSVKAAFARTITEITSTLAARGHTAQFVYVGCSDIALGRNILAHYFWRDPSFTHLLFIDSDMTFPAQVALDMLAADKPLLGTAYPKRHVDLKALVAAARETTLPLEDLLARVLQYTVLLDPGTHEVTNGLVKVASFGFGCVLLQREALRRLVAAGVAPIHTTGPYRDSGILEPVNGFFDPIILPDGTSLSEDRSFCHRWKQVPGNETWALIDRVIGHVGNMTYETPYFFRLRQGLL